MTTPSVTAARQRLLAAQGVYCDYLTAFSHACLMGIAAPDRTPVDAAHEALVDALQGWATAIRAAMFR